MKDPEDPAKMSSVHSAGPDKDVHNRLNSMINHVANPLKTLSDFMEENPPQLGHSVHNAYAEIVNVLWKGVAAGEVPEISCPKNWLSDSWQVHRPER